MAIADISEAATLEGISKDIDALSNAAGTLSLADARRGMELGAMAGQIGTVGDAVRAMGMESLGAFLDEMSRRIRAIAAGDILQSQDTRGLAQAMSIAGAGIEGVGEVEAAAAAAEMANAQIAAEASVAAASIADEEIAQAMNETSRAKP